MIAGYRKPGSLYSDRRSTNGGFPIPDREALSSPQLASSTVSRSQRNQIGQRRIYGVITQTDWSKLISHGKKSTIPASL